MTITENDTAMTMIGSGRKDGRVVGIAGPVIDVEFPRGSLPELNHGARVRPSPSTARTSRCSPRSPSSSARAASGPSA